MGASIGSTDESTTSNGAAYHITRKVESAYLVAGSKKLPLPMPMHLLSGSNQIVGLSVNFIYTDAAGNGIG